MDNRVIVACLSALVLLTGCGRDVRCGKTESGDVVSFVRSDAGTFGISVVRADGDGLIQDTPARVLLCADGKTLSSQEAGYGSVKRSGGGVEALAEIAAGGSVFSFRDLWRVEGDALYLDRTVTVANTVEGTGFCTEASLVTTTDVQWQDRKYFLPGVIYGEPHTTARAKGGSQFHDAGFFSLREDYLSAPLAAVVDDNFGWFGLLNRKPDGATTGE